MKVLGIYNQQLAAALSEAEQHWPTLCAAETEELSKAETEDQHRVLLLAMTYLDQLRRLLCRQTRQHETAVFRNPGLLLQPGIGPAG